MKIVDLHIQGFRSLKEVTWKPGDLNLIIGPNGSGKSNLLKALEMLSGSARGRLADQVTREGGMESLVWDGQATGAVRWNLHFQREEPDLVNRLWSYELDIQRMGATSAYQIEQEELGTTQEIQPFQITSFEFFSEKILRHPSQNREPFYSPMKVI